MDQRNPNYQRPGTQAQHNHSTQPQRFPRNEMFFTEDDDADSIFGSDRASVIENGSVIDQSTQQYVRQQNQQLGHSQNHANTNGFSEVRQNHHIPTYNTSGNSMLRAPPSFAQASRNALHRPPVPTGSVADTIYIKDEEDMEEKTVNPGYLHDVPVGQLVKIFVGKHNKSIHVDRSDLRKCSTLLSYIVEDSTAPFIMRPQLMNTHFDDFAAVAEYLHTGEYTPALIENPVDKEGPKILAGLKHDNGYGKQLAKAGNLWRLTMRFNIEGLADLIFKKVSQVDFGKYSMASVIRFATIVFSKQVPNPYVVTKSTQGNGPTTEGSVVADGDDGDKNPMEREDAMEDWVIEKLAYNLQEIMRTHREQFFEMVKSTGKKMLYARILEQAARDYRASGGRLPDSIIQLD